MEQTWYHECSTRLTYLRATGVRNIQVSRAALQIDTSEWNSQSVPVALDLVVYFLAGRKALFQGRRSVEGDILVLHGEPTFIAAP